MRKVAMTMISSRPVRIVDELRIEGLGNMKIFGKTLALATVALSLTLLASARNTKATQDSATTQSAAMNTPSNPEAASLVPVNAVLSHALDARKDHPGSAIEAKLTEKAHLSDGTELPSGSILMGQVVTDDMQHQGKSTLALRFDQARLKDGKVIPIRATIVGLLSPVSDTGIGYAVPNNWTDATLQIDEVGVVPGVDLHSNITSQNSGVFVSTKKDNVKLAQGSQVQLAIGPRSAA
jgi:hypothetical protein